MSDTPEILSPEQIIGLLVDSYLSKSPTANDLRKGSVLLSLIEAFGQVGFKVSSTVITMLDSISIDRATGDALKRIAIDKRVPIFSASNASGFVNITDTSFTKVQDKIYAGRPAPVAGSAFVFVSDATQFPQVGQIYLGRGTSSVDGPLAYGTTSRLDPDDGFTPVQGIVSKAGGAYFMIVLDNTNETTKFHNLGESVVLAQGGDRTIPVGTTVQTSQATSAEAVTFVTTSTAKILDGETDVTRIPIAAQQSGTASNVARGSISTILGVGFDATCFNSLPLTNARDDDTDEVLRERIKQYEQAKSKGTEAAIIRYSIDVVSPDELKRVSSASIKRSAGTEQALVFDDGTGYEPIDAGIGLEQLLDEALGGEKEFQLLNTMVERATVKTLASAPFDIIAGDVLQVEIIGKGLFSHTFQEGDFRVFRQADAFEVVSSINSNFDLPFVARTVATGTKVTLTPKDAHNIRVVSGGANLGLKFPTNPVYTIRLYRNDIAVYQEGKPAFVTSLSQPSWGTIIAGYTFKFTVDNTTSVNASLSDADFQKYGPTYVVNKDTPLDIWALVLNDKLPGVTTTVVGDALRFTSNKGSDDRAAISIDTTNTSFVGASMFGTNVVAEESGLGADFNFNLKTGQLEWLTPFSVGETATAGSKFTRAKFESFLLSSVLSLGSNMIYMWMTIDGNATSIAHSTTGVNVTIDRDPSGWPVKTAKIAANSGAYSNVRPGDRMIIWKNPGETFINGSNCGIFRVYDIDPTGAGDYVIIDAPESVDQLTPFALPASGRFVFVRSDTPVQVVEIDPNTITTPAALRDTFNAQLVGARSYMVGTTVRVESKTLDESRSQILLAAMTDNTAPLGFELGTYGSVSSHNGFVNSSEQVGYGMPTFKLLASQNASLSPNISDASRYLFNDGTENDILQWLDWNTGRYEFSSGSITSYNNKSMNKGSYEQVRRYNTSTNKIEPVRRGLTYRGVYDDGSSSFNLDGGYYLDEPYTLRQGLVFDAADTLSFIVDQDELVKSYITPVARKVTISGSPSPNPIQFNLLDAESNLSFNSPSTFRDFDFSNFKFWTNPKMSVQGMDFLYKDFGPAGSKMGVSLRLAATPDQTTSHEIREGDITDIRILLASGPAEQNDSDFSTTWIVDIVSTVGNIDYVTYTWKTGTNPNLSVTAGSTVTIEAGASLRSENKGTFVVTTNPLYPPTATTFTVERPTGLAVSDQPAISSLVYPFVALTPFSSGGTMEITTATDHNLQVGDIVGVYDADVTDYIASYTVTAVNTSLVFQAKVDPGIISGGAIQQIIRRVQLASAPAWSSATSFTADEVVAYVGQTYIALGPSLNAQPNISPASWQLIPAGPDYITVLRTAAPHGLTVGDDIKVSDIPNLGLSTFNGTFQVFTSSSPDRISHLHTIGTSVQGIGLTNLTQGRVDQQANVFGNLSKGLKSDDALSFYTSTDTQASVQTYISTNLDQYLEMTPTSPATPVTPTSDLYIDASTSIVISPYYGSVDRLITLDSAIPFTKGTKITMQLPASADPLRSDVHDIELTVVSVDGNSFRVRSTRYALPAEVPLTLGAITYRATQEVHGFGEGESYVLTNDLSITPSSPGFTLKQPLLDVASGDEAYLIATNPEQLARLLARLANSGLSNVAEVGTSFIDSELQVKSNTFGSDGGVQMSGGRANSHSAAIVGAGQTRDSVGGFDIQTDLRIGMTPGSFIRAVNTVAGRKTLGLDALTQVSVTSVTGKGVLTITTGPGTFQTKRSVTIDGTQDIKVERHGDFFCYQLVGGTDLDLITQGVKEGDWVRIQDEARNTSIASYSLTSNVVTVTTNVGGHIFGVGDRVVITGSDSGAENIDGTYTITSTPDNTHFTFALVAANFGTQVPTSLAQVETQPRFLSTNQGIFQIVALYGDAFWIENPNGLEQFAEDVQSSSLAFYSYDSVMPGDLVQISSDILGADNIGTFTVDTWDDLSAIPSATQMRVIGTITTQAATSLGTDVDQLNVIERSPLEIIKKIYSTGPSATDSSFSFVSVTNAELVDRINTTLGGGISSLTKLDMDESTKLGLDAYRFYEGLIKQLYKVLYGDPTDPAYEGVRAAGTDIDIQPPLIRRIKVTLNIRIKTGIPFSEVTDAVKSAAAGYINSLGVGQPVSLSAMTAAIQTVDGVVAVVVDTTSPVADNGLIKVLPEEVASIVDPDTDVVVNIVSG